MHVYVSASGIHIELKTPIAICGLLVSRYKASSSLSITYIPLSVSQVLNSHSHVMYILSILLAKYTEVKVSLKSRKTMA